MCALRLAQSLKSSDMGVAKMARIRLSSLAGLFFSSHFLTFSMYLISRSVQSSLGFSTEHCKAGTESPVMAKISIWNTKTSPLNDSRTLDFGRTAVVPVCQFAWNVQFPLVTSNHQLHRFRPSFNHLVGSERSGLTTFVTRVEYGPVNESPLVVTRTGRIDSGVSGSFSFRQDLVLKTGRKRNNTWFLFVLFQKGQPSLVGAGRHEQQ